MTKTIECQQCEHSEQAKDAPYTPVLQIEYDKHTQEQQRATEQEQHKLRKEIGECRHVAVDAFDKFAGSVGIVESHTQREVVCGEIVAQGVRGRPGHVAAKIGRADRKHLRDDAEDEEEQRECDQDRSHRLASSRRIDQITQELWDEYL